MKFLKKVETASEAVSQEFSTLYSINGGGIFIKKAKKPNIVLYYNDGTKQEYPDATEMTWNLISGKTEYYNENTTLVNVELNDGVTSISDSAFYECSGLSSITISNSITSIGDSTFLNCHSLTSVTIPNSVTSIGSETFCGSFITSIVIPDSVTSLGNGAFQDCPKLTSVVIGNGVIEIGTSTFESCYALTSATLFDSIVRIEDWAFCDSDKLQIRYYGTSKQWDAIYKGRDYINEKCTVHIINMIDLGLPSGTLWAECNIGATKPEERGKYFMWGDVEGEFIEGTASTRTYDWANTPFNNGSSNYDSAYFASVSGTVCPNGVLSKEYDAAYLATDGVAHIPTPFDTNELVENTTSAWTQVNGVNGVKFTSKVDETKYIFIPAVGFCQGRSIYNIGSVGFILTSKLDHIYFDNFVYLDFNSEEVNPYDTDTRPGGYSVRAVRSVSK